MSPAAPSHQNPSTDRGPGPGSGGPSADRPTDPRPLTRNLPWYDPVVTGRIFDDMKRYIGFAEAEARALASLSRPLHPALEDVADLFYETLLSHAGANAVLTQLGVGTSQLRQTMLRWLRDLFCGQYDDAYFEKRCEIGRAHVRAQVPQRYVFTGMNVIRRALVERIGGLSLPDAGRKVDALHKLLDLELAIMTETYCGHFVSQIQQHDHERFRRQLSESEHLANIGQLAAALAHEIKNPLAGISGAIQILGAELEDGHPHKDAIVEALRQIDRLDATVKDLLVYARPPAPVRARRSLGEIVERTLILFRGEPSFRDVQIGCEGLDCDTRVEVDEYQIQQVITNLMLNAAHACENGGEVICRLTPIDDGIRIIVEDNGCGMPPESLSKAFEPFHTTKVRGTGLGLPICKRIVEAHGGTIRIESQVGKGTAVVIEMPRTT